MYAGNGSKSNESLEIITSDPRTNFSPSEINKKGIKNDYRFCNKSQPIQKTVNANNATPTPIPLIRHGIFYDGLKKETRITIEF